MKRMRYISALCMFLFSFGLQHVTQGQPESINLEIMSKDFDAEVMPLTDRVDPNKNYLILFSAFWCSPCVKAINDVHSKKIEEYREKYNLEVIILDDDNYNNLSSAKGKIKNNQWYFNMYFLNNKYGTLGINAIPRYYFLPAGKKDAIRVSRVTYLEDIVDYYKENGYSSLFFEENSQTIVDTECSNLSRIDFASSDELIINGVSYYSIEGKAFRSDILNKNIYRYDPLAEKEVLVFDYYLDMCDSYTLRDHEGDILDISIESIEYDFEGEIRLETDVFLASECGTSRPFIMSSKYGSNAGILFDIENGEIVTRLVCHQQNGELLYLDYEIEQLCNSVSSSELSEITELKCTNNPGDGVFLIQTNEETTAVKILNIEGRVISNYGKLKTIDISSSPPGIYFVEVINSSKQKQIIRYIKQ